MKFMAFTALLLAGFAWAEWRGMTPFAGDRKHPPVPASVRSSPGGYRSYHFWHTGFQGGK
jgi:hypothetical protein